LIGLKLRCAIFSKPGLLVGLFRRARVFEARSAAHLAAVFELT